ncbi:MAG: hypothetical protein KIT48_00390 [Pseudolabrys sp.]|nr:hypothetical protein [Pseudolabrys sp.]
MRRSRKSSVTIGGQVYDLEAPGLKCVRRRRTTDLYWACDEGEEFSAYKPRSVRIHVNTSATEAHDVDRALQAIEDICRREQGAMLSWADGHRADRERLAPRFDGTMGSLIALCRSDPESGYQDLKSNTKASYDEAFKVVTETIGSRRLDCIHSKWFRTCYRNWRAPASVGGPERLRRAYYAIQVVRVALDYGVQSGLPNCQRLRDGMSKIRFAKNAPREEAMTYSQAVAIVDRCLRSNDISMALCQAVQWDTMMRQKDTIGEWRPEPACYQLKPGEIRRGQRVWSGLTIDKLEPGATLVVRTTKTAQPVVHLISECHLILRCLPYVDRSAPHAPVAVNSHGTPWADHRSFGKAWRSYADRCGVPQTVRNMDSRAGGITEASAGGASDDDLATQAGQADKSTTRRIYKRQAVEVSRRVQSSRRAARKIDNQPSPNPSHDTQGDEP